VTAGSNKPWSDDELDRLVRMLSQDSSHKEIAAELGPMPSSGEHRRLRLTGVGRWSLSETIGSVADA